MFFQTKLFKILKFFIFVYKKSKVLNKFFQIKKQNFQKKIYLKIHFLAKIG